MTTAPVAGRIRPEEDPFAAALRGFGPIGILAILLILAGNLLVVPLSAILVLAWARASHTPWRDIGLVKPRSWLVTALIGIAFGVAFKFVMKAIVMPLLGAPPVNQAFHYLAGNRAALPAAIYAMTVGAGFGEETLFRGFLFERLGRWLGSWAWAKAAIVMITAVLFGLAHLAQQGLPGAAQATIVGLVYGAIYARTGRLFLLMFAHAAFDLTALWMIYWNLEPVIAHFFFK